MVIYFYLMSKEVPIIYNGVTREILRRTMMKTEYFADKYESEQDFCWEGLFSQECFSIFWKYCPDIFEDIISQAKYEFDHTIIHNEHQYQGNLRKYSTLFPYFSSQVKS